MLDPNYPARAETRQALPGMRLPFCHNLYILATMAYIWPRGDAGKRIPENMGR